MIGLSPKLVYTFIPSVQRILWSLFWIFQFSADFWDFSGEILSFFQKSTEISSKKSQKSAENGNFQKRLHRIIHTDGMKVETNFWDNPITQLRENGNGDEFLDHFFKYGKSYTFRDISRNVSSSRWHRISPRQAF